MHYKDGTLAKIGDHVKGKLYNTPHEVSGTLVSITPGVDSCNAMVAFVEADKLDKGIPHNSKLVHVAKDQSHGSAGEQLAHVVKHDYCAVGDLEKVSSPAHAYALPS